MKNNISQLAKKARNGDARAFGEIYSQFSHEMYRYALYHLGCPQAAQDAVQDAALEAWKSINRLRNENAAKAWLFRILSHCCKHSLRERYKADFSDIEACAEIVSDDSSNNLLLGIDLVHLLEKLENSDREIVVLAAVCGFNSKEISDITSLKPSTVRSKLSRSLSVLRTTIEKGETDK